MRLSKPPAIATWLLLHLGFSPKNESLIGDLEERYASGHSPLWYWKQVLMTIVVSWFAEVTSNKIATLGALAISWIHIVGLVRVFQYLASGAANPLTAYTFTNLLPYEWWGHNAVFWPVDWLLTWSPLFLISISTGWVIARFPRRHSRATVLTCAVFTGFVMAVPSYQMLLELPAVSLFFSVRALFVPFQTLLGILLGGGLLITPRSISLRTQ